MFTDTSEEGWGEGGVGAHTDHSVRRSLVRLRGGSHKSFGAKSYSVWIEKFVPRQLHPYTHSYRQCYALAYVKNMGGTRSGECLRVAIDI